MPQGTCHWPDCDRDVHGRNLCKSHGQRARREGITDQFWQPGVCKQCGVRLSGGRATKVYCSRRCTNVANWAASDKQERARRHLEWYHSVTPARRQAALAVKPSRYCCECGVELPVEAKSNRKFCSRRCINLTRLREKRYQAVEAHRRRHQRLAGPGVSEKDWLALLRRYGNCCAYCGSRDRITQDHVVPVSRGGQHAIGNILPACWACNCNKRFRLLVEWRMGKSASIKTLIPGATNRRGDMKAGPVSA